MTKHLTGFLESKVPSQIHSNDLFQADSHSAVIFIYKYEFDFLVAKQQIHSSKEVKGSFEWAAF